MKKNEPKIDRRAKRSQKTFEEAFIRLLKRKEIHKITVTNLCEEADLNRGTFYIHYDDVYDLLEKVEDNLISDLDNILDNSPIIKSPLGGTAFTNDAVKALEYIEENKEIFRILFNDNGDLMFIAKIKKVFSKKLINDIIDLPLQIDKRYYAILSAFFITGMIGIIQEWIKSDTRISAFELATVMENMLKNGSDFMK